jgi:hypothetical protein
MVCVTMPNVILVSVFMCPYAERVIMVSVIMPYVIMVCVLC